MENQATINRESWKETLTILLHPAVIIPIIIGFGAALLVFNTDDNYWKMILTAVSSIGLGIGVNYFTFFFKDNTKYNKLMETMNQKAINEATSIEKIKAVGRLLDSMIVKIKNHAQGGNRDLNPFEKQQISDIGVLLDSIGNYYTSNYDAQLSDLVRMRFERDNAKDADTRNKLTYICNTYDYILTERKVKAHIDATGSLSIVDSRYINPLPDQFVGSIGNNESTFNVPDTPEK